MWEATRNASTGEENVLIGWVGVQSEMCRREAWWEIRANTKEGLFHWKPLLSQKSIQTFSSITLSLVVCSKIQNSPHCKCIFHNCEIFLYFSKLLVFRACWAVPPQVLFGASIPPGRYLTPCPGLWSHTDLRCRCIPRELAARLWWECWSSGAGM